MRRKSKGLPKADWVYRATDPNGSTIGSYDPNQSHALNAGLEGASFCVLYDSVDFMRTLHYDSLTSSDSTYPRASRAEGRRPLILAVEGSVIWLPSAWAIGSSWFAAGRLGPFEQDTTLGGASIQAEWGIWQTPLGNMELSTFANARQNLRTWWHTKGFNDNGNRWMTRYRWRGKHRLYDSKTCFGMYFEAPDNSVNMTFLPLFRTLVVDEG